MLCLYFIPYCGENQVIPPISGRRTQPPSGRRQTGTQRKRSRFGSEEIPCPAKEPRHQAGLRAKQGRPSAAQRAAPAVSPAERVTAGSEEIPCPAKKPRRKAGLRAKQGISELVPVTGLEPVRCRQRWILSPLRLPIPSHRQKRLKILYTSGWESARAELGNRPDFFKGAPEKKCARRQSAAGRAPFPRNFSGLSRPGRPASRPHPPGGCGRGRS